MRDVPVQYLSFLWSSGMSGDFDSPVAGYIRKSIPSLEQKMPGIVFAKSPERPKQKSIPELEKQCEDFNKTYPVGTCVKRYVLVNPLREPTETRTRSNAFVNDGKALIFVDGQPSYILLDSIVPM